MPYRSLDEDFQIYNIYYDLEGHPVKRTPIDHPYCYDEFVIYKSKDFDYHDNMDYSDRLLQWNRDAFGKAATTVWPDKFESQSFSNRSPEDINRFLNLYFGKEVKLTAILQGCNCSSGYPYWIFAYKE